MDKQEHKGWYSRGYLPHCDEPNRIQMITYRLADSLPKEVVKKLLQDFPEGSESGKRKRIEEYMDAGYGACRLANPQIAEIVQENLLRFDGERYRLIAWVVMPNHIHVVVEILEGFNLEQVIHTWKSYTANAANKTLGRQGDFWQPDYFDRFIRDAEHLERAVNYVEYNPVKAGLVEKVEDWLFGSGRYRGMEKE